MSGCEISSSGQPGRRVLSVVGETDLAAAQKLEAGIAGAVEDLDPGTGLVLDLSGVSFLDSSGLRALMLGAEAVRLAEVRLSFVLSPEVGHVLELSGLTPDAFGIDAADWPAVD